MERRQNENFSFRGGNWEGCKKNLMKRDIFIEQYMCERNDI